MGRLESLQEIAGAGIRVDMAKALAGADARHADKQAQIEALKKLAQSQQSLAAAEARNNLLKFAHVVLVELHTRFQSR